ncbi:zinc finger protein 37-like [Ischnura elegans]|uniref:zinc finger protein 37-like n=1 Tax=Ischnura elegans TaxID=197161 RepID=UPI001ED885CD|nr:zinc finger protein 37-like [Ischnura elegans]
MGGLANTYSAAEPAKREKVEAQSRGIIVADLDLTLIGAKKELSPEENAQALKGGADTEVSEGDLPEDQQSEEYDEEESFCLMLESDSDEGDDCRNSDAGTKVDADYDHMQAQASTSSQGEDVDAEGTGAIVIVQDSMPVLAEKESPKETGATEPTSKENGELIQKQTMTMESMTEALDLPAPERASDFFALYEPKIRESHSRKAWKVMNKDIEICGSLLADKITLCSIPDDGQFHSKSRRVSKTRGDRGTTTVAGEIIDCDNPDITKVSRVCDIGKSGPKAVVRENKEISTSMIKNPGKRARSKDNSYRCFNCGDAFNAKHDLIEHLKIHCGSGSLDIDANLSIGKHVALKTLVSRVETDSSYQPTSSNGLNKLLRKRQGGRQKGNGLFKEKFGGTTEKKIVRKVRRSSIVDGKSCTDSPRTTKKPSCGECEWSFPKKSYLVRHIQNHAKETAYSCNECEKSFSRKSYLNDHYRTHTQEKPYSCNQCEESFSVRSNLVCHMRTHTKEKTYFCKECEKSFSNRSSLIQYELEVGSGVPTA